MMDAAWSALLPPAAEWHTTPATAAPAHPAGHGEHGEPLWPDGIVGSITHAGGYRTIATAPADRVASLGIDMEPLMPIPAEVWPHFLDSAELEQLLAMPAPQRGLAALSCWCLKEALFKALHGRIPLGALPLARGEDAWRPMPALKTALQRFGIEDPERLVLQSAACGGWVRATAWFSRIRFPETDAPFSPPIPAPG